MIGLWNRLGGAVCVVILASLAAYWMSLYQEAMERLPTVRTLDTLALPIAPENSLTIGRPDLLQRPLDDAAEPEHLELFRNTQGALFLRNVAAKRRMFLDYENAGFFADEAILSDGDELKLGGVRLKIEVHDGTLQLFQIIQDEKAETLESLAKVPAPYPTNYTRLKGIQSNTIRLGGSVTTDADNDRLGSFTRRVEVFLDYSMTRIVGSLTGNTPSGPFRYVKLPSLPENAIQITYENGLFIASRQEMRLVEHCPNGQGCAFIGRQAWSYKGHDETGELRRVTMGRTTYDIRFDGTDVTLAPLNRRHWWPTSEAFPTPQADMRVEATPTLARGLKSLDETLLGTSWQRLFGPPLALLLVLVAVLLVVAPIVAATRSARRKNAVTRQLYSVLVIALTVLLPLHSLPGLGPLLARLAPAAQLLLFLLIYLFFTGHWRSKLGAALLLIHGIIAAFGVAILRADFGAIPIEKVYGTNLHISAFAVVLLYLLCGFALFSRAVAPILQLFWLALSGLVALGTVNGALLAMGQPYALHGRLYETHLAVAGATAALCALVALIPVDKIRHALTSVFLGRGLWHLPNWALAAIILTASLLLSILTFLGDEEGIGGIQPTELSKSVIVVFFALYLVTLQQMDRIRAASVNALVSLSILAVCFLALMSASLANFDLSPILIVLLTLCAIAFVNVIFWLVRLFGDLSIVMAPLLVAALFIGLQMPVLLTYCVSLGALIMATSTRTSKRGKVPRLPPQRVRVRGGYVVDLKFLPQIKFGLGVYIDRLLNRQSKQVFALALSVLLFVWLAQISAPRVEVLFDKEKLEQFETDLPRTPTERVVSWYDSTLFPAAGADAYLVGYPDFSFQVRKSREVLAATGCTSLMALRRASDRSATLRNLREIGWLTAIETDADALCKLGAGSEAAFPRYTVPHKSLYAVPAVQDDFVATFFVANFGLDMARLLMGLQLLIVISMGVIASSAALVSARDMRLRGHGMLAAYAIGGFAVMLGLQFVFSWANVYGLLPVVGQPMTFLSFGGSHHLLLALPLATTTILLTSVVCKPRDIHSENRDLRVNFRSPSRPNSYQN